MTLRESCGGWELRWLNGSLQGWYSSKTKAHKALEALNLAPVDDGFEIRCYQCKPEN